MVKVLFDSIFQFFSKIIDVILSPLNFPAVPPRLVTAVNTLFGYMRSGMAIINFFCPIAQIKPALVLFAGVFAVKHSYSVIMWVLRKIPFFNIS